MRHCCLLLLGLIVSLGTMPTVRAQSNETAASAAGPPTLEAAFPVTAAVQFRGQDLFELRAPIGTYSIADRATAIQERLVAALAQTDLRTDALRLAPTRQSVDIFVGSQFVTSVTDADAAPVGRTRQQLAADERVRIQHAIQATLEGQSIRGLLLAALRSAVTVILAVVTIFGIRRLVNGLERRLTRLAKRKVAVIRFLGFTLFSPDHAIPLTQRSLLGLRWILIAVTVIAAAEYVLHQFVWTQGIADSTTQAAVNAVRWVISGIIGFIPNVVVLTILGFAVRYALKILKVVIVRWAALDTRKFPNEWVQPTYQIIRFIVVALVLVIAFPYLPGSQSKAFQGVSIFVGVLFSLGSSAAIGNMVAGIVLIYMRAVKPGDRVKIADTVGDVISCEVLALRLRTIKNVDILVPNALVLSNHIINFSAQAAEGRLILHTGVTIGYDAEWKTVHQLLIAAALATPDIESSPEPFVLQTSLDDFYVAYEINAYTRKANAMAQIYSDLHANIQDKFNEGGVEILSPHYAQLRDGNRTAVPDPYLPKDYRTPTFGLSMLRSK